MSKFENIHCIAEKNNMVMKVTVDRTNNLYYNSSPQFIEPEYKECTIELTGSLVSANNFDNDLMLASDGYDTKQRQINSLNEELSNKKTKLEEILNAIEIIKEKLQYEADTDIFYSFSYEKCLKIINESLP